MATQISRRLGLLEQRARTLLGDEQREAEAKAEQHWQDTFDILWKAIPASSQRAFAQLVRSDHFMRNGLYSLFLYIWHGELAWKRPKGVLPAFVVQTFLDDPKATAHRLCDECHLPLPYRPGFWVKDNHFWQAGQHYGIKTCPACGGKVSGGYPHRQINALAG
jgi:hypothetical protein